MKNILMIGPFSPPITGNSFANDTLLNGLKNKNIQVGKINFAFPSIKGNLGELTLSKLIHYILIYRYLFKVFSSDKIYVTLGQTFYGVLKYAPFIYLAKVQKKEIIVHIHGDYLRNEYKHLRGYKKILFKKILSQFDKGIVLSYSLRKNLTPFIESDSIFFVYNFVEDNILKNITSEDINNKNVQKLKIVFLSNLTKGKGVFDLFQSLKLLKMYCIPFEAKMAGAIDPIFEDELKKLFDEFKEDVEYLGVVTGNQKLKLLVESNVFVLPTYYSMEGQPISILEAMATGNIILTTNHAGIPDIFDNERNGFYVEKQNPEDIFDKLNYISKNLELMKPIMKNNYLESCKKYTTDRYINAIINVISK